MSYCLIFNYSLLLVVMLFNYDYSFKFILILIFFVFLFSRIIGFFDSTLYFFLVFSFLFLLSRYYNLNSFYYFYFKFCLRIFVIITVYIVFIIFILSFVRFSSFYIKKVLKYFSCLSCGLIVNQSKFKKFSFPYYFQKRLYSVSKSDVVSCISLDKKITRVIRFCESENIVFNSSLTLMYPLEVCNLKIKLLDDLKRFIRQVRKFVGRQNKPLIYISSFELSEKNNLVHIHLICNYSFVDNFMALKIFWFKTLNLYLKGLQIEKAKLEEIQNQSLFYTCVESDKISQGKILKYTFKNINNDSLKEKLNLKYLFSISHGSLSEMVLKVFPYKKTEEERLELVESDKISQVDLAFKKLLLDHPFYKKYEKKIIVEQLLQEFEYFSGVIDRFSFENLNQIDSSQQIPFVKLRFLIKEIASETFSFFTKSVVQVYKDIDRVSETRKKILIAFNNLFGNESDSFHYFNVLQLFIMFGLQERSSFDIFIKIGRYCFQVQEDSKDEKVDLQALDLYILCGYTLFSTISKLLSDILLLGLESPENSLSCNTKLDIMEAFNAFSHTFEIKEMKTFRVFVEFKTWNTPFWTQVRKDALRLSLQKLIFANGQFPMKIQPKDWKNISSDVDLIDTRWVQGGGFLLNRLFIGKTRLNFAKPLCEIKKIGDFHTLRVKEKVITILNKIQSAFYRFDSVVFNFFKKNVSILPDILSNKKKQELRTKLTNIRSDMTNLFKDIKNINFAIHKLEESFEEKKVGKTKHEVSLLKSSLGFDKEYFLSLLKKTRKKLGYLYQEREDVVGTIGRSDQLEFIIHLFENVSEKDELFYPLKLDFRGRIYPINTLSHPMGSKFTRSFIRTGDFAEFSENYFKKYAFSCFAKVFHHSETDMYLYFDCYIKPIFEKSLSDFTSYIKKNISKFEEPYTFIACYFEYQKYITFERTKKDGEVFMTNFPIYLDATASGPQLVSILFALEKFSDYLNLTLQTAETKKGDFYVGILKLFVDDCKDLYIFNYDEIEENSSKFYTIMRKVFKKLIMTQFYGVTQFKFLKESKLGFEQNWEALSTFFHILPDQDSNYEFFLDERSALIKKFQYRFWDFLRNLPLFQLRGILEKLYSLTKSTNSTLTWSMFLTEITLDYRKLKKKKVKFKLDNRSKYFHQISSTDSSSSKNISSAMANFIHSIDAYVMTRVLEKTDYSVIMIHDSWGQAGKNCEKTISIVKNVYSDLLKDKALFKYVCKNFVEFIKSNVDLENRDLFAQDFLKYIEDNVLFENLNPDSVSESRFLIS